MTSARRLTVQPARAASPLRRLNLLHDLDEVADLVEIAFRDEPGRDIHQFRSELRSMRSVGPLLWGASRISPAGSDLLTGYVFESGGRIVGCLTLSRLAGRPVRWLVANVAVHPDFRRRGIARQLVQAAIEHAQVRGDGLLVLDVRRENTGAYQLYQQLGFTLREETAEWRWLPGNGWPQAVPAVLPIRFDPLEPAQWRRARALVNEALTPAAREAAPVADGEWLLYGLLGPLLSIGSWFRTRDTIRLAAGGASRLDGLIVSRAQRWAGLHQIQVVLRPGTEASLAGAAVSSLVSALRDYPPLPVVASLRSPHQALLDALDAVGFQERQTLHRLARRV